MKQLSTKRQQYPVFLLTLITAVLLLAPPVFSQQKGIITSLENGIVRINWGTFDGIAPGAVLNIFREEIKYHPATGERIATHERLIGKIEVVQCLDDNSSAKIVNFTEEFKIGDIIKISYDEQGFVKSLPQSAEKGTILNVDNLIVTFNMGRIDGVEPNLYFDIYRIEGASTHPVTGAPIEQKRIYIGRLQAISVENDFTTGQVIARERDVLQGDMVELSSLQATDLEMAEIQMATEPEPVVPEVRDAISKETEQIAPPSNIVGTVTRVSARDIFFLWREDYGFPVGRVFGIFRRIELSHPETGVIMDRPLIQIATATLRESIGELGKAYISSSDADILPNDFIGLTGGERVSAKQIITPENIEQVYETQRSDILKLAHDLTNQVRNMQAEMTVVRTALNKLDRIDRDLAAQKTLTNEILNEIRMIRRGEGLAAADFELPPLDTSVERMEIPGARIKELRLQYPDYIGVDFQLEGNRLSVIMDVDTTGKRSLIPEEEMPPDTVKAYTAGAGSTIETVPPEQPAETPFWRSLPGLFIILLILSAIAGALYFLYHKKKASTGTASTKVDEEPEEESFEEEDDEEFAEELEEIIPEDEALEDIDTESQ